jgi:hypothetical protein
MEAKVLKVKRANGDLYKELDVAKEQLKESNEKAKSFEYELVSVKKRNSIL